MAKEGPCFLALVANAVSEIGGGTSCKQILLGDPETTEIGLGKVDAVFSEIDRDVLPKVRQLQAGAHMVGKLGEFGASFSMNQENQPADRVCASATIVEHIGEGFVSPLDNVLSKGAEKIREQRVRQVQLGFCFLKRGEDPLVLRVVRLAVQGHLPGFLIGFKGSEALGLGGGLRIRGFLAGIGVPFVGQIVGHPGEGIDGVDVGAEFLGYEAADWKVFVVFSGQLAARGVGIAWRSYGTTRKRAGRVDHPSKIAEKLQ